MNPEHRTLPPPDYAEIERIIGNALAEDVGQGDITSELLIPEETKAELQFASRETLIACGLFIPQMVYKALGENVSTQTHAREGQKMEAGKILVTAKGPARTLLTGERVTLNLMQRMSGIAMVTRRYVDAVAGTGAVILDTRKTMPGLRALDKYAVLVGGGQNHRMRLDDMVLIKDNHIELAGSISKAVEKIKRDARFQGNGALKIEVECDTLAQLEGAIAAKPDRIMLDNMSVAELKKAVALTAGRVPLEASGGISLESVAAIAQTGVDYISVGALTHSAPAADIGADITLR